jgi:hypothetical protein
VGTSAARPRRTQDRMPRDASCQRTGCCACQIHLRCVGLHRGHYASHKNPKVKAWLAAKPRLHMHFIPTYSSWLNQVERFFA